MAEDTVMCEVGAAAPGCTWLLPALETWDGNQLCSCAPDKGRQPHGGLQGRLGLRVLGGLTESITLESQHRMSESLNPEIPESQNPRISGSQDPRILE